MADVTPATDGLRNRWKSGEWSIAGTGASRNPESDDFSLIAWIEMLDARIDAEVTARKAAEAERDEARRFGEEAAAKHNALLADTRILRCAFCDAEYPPDTPPTQHDALTQHVKVCPKHPMREVEAERDAWVARTSKVLLDAGYTHEADGCGPEMVRDPLDAASRLADIVRQWKDQDERDDELQQRVRQQQAANRKLQRKYDTMKGGLLKERDELRAQLAAAESERELLLVVVTHAEALIDNQANTTSQAYAICNSLHNSVARWRNRKAREQADGE